MGEYSDICVKFTVADGSSKEMSCHRLILAQSEYVVVGGAFVAP